MSTKQYFDILGIPPTKNEKLIKRAYRKKAMKYHPDRNPSIEAKEKFIQVTEAYDKLLLILAHSNNQQTANTTHSQSNTRHTTSTRSNTRGGQKSATQQSYQRTKANPREERVNEARQRYENMKRREAEEDKRYFHNITTGKNWKRFKIIMLACTFMSLLISLDALYFSTQTIPSKIVNKEAFKAHRGSNSRSTTPVIFENGQKAWIPLDFVFMEKSNFIYLERTPIFKDIKYVKIYSYNRWHYYTPDFSLMSTFPIIPLVLLIPLFTFFIKAETIYFSVLYHTSVKFMPVFLIVLLISNDRWAHLITLGLMS